ncbi:CROLIN 1 [Hibiscus trionum]|uniref:CROLIN 1 n=1 Tax=Hibiscus trionum TaxID=183268 RepID=A0A9W7GZP1_HIBTR|nr:CROLIN 1 [Hibiscus trionum]
MEIFQKSRVVRLCSHHERLLVANDDQETVSQERDWSSMKAQWTVEFPESSSIHIRLESCYGKYVTASNMPFLIGLRGKMVLQTLPRRLTSSVEWEPIGEGVQDMLRPVFARKREVSTVEGSHYA